jgi:predicted N-acetyltransferase YhbS
MSAITTDSRGADSPFTPPAPWREETPADREAVHALLRERFERALQLAGLPASLATPLAASQAATMLDAHRQAHPNAQAFVRGAGAILHARIDVDTSTQPWCLVDITVAATHRGAGLGTVALRALLPAADAANASVRGSVEADSDARRWYARHGFAAIGGDDTPIVRLVRAPQRAVIELPVCSLP